MPNPLFTVEYTFVVEGRGLVIDGITVEQYGLIKPGDRLKLKRPDGSTVFAKAIGIEYPSSIIWVDKRPENPRYGILVDRNDIPAGTEAFVESDRPSENDDKSN